MLNLVLSVHPLHSFPSLSDVSTSQGATQAYGNEFVSALKQTRAFALWNSTTDPMIFDIVEHKHPCDGKTSSLEDVAIRLSSGFHDLHLEENLGPTREAIGNAIQAGGANVWRLANKFGQDLNKIRQQAAQAAAEASAKRNSQTPSSSSTSNNTPSTQQTSYFPPEAAQAAAQASNQVKAAFGSFGSFLASKQSAWRSSSSSSSNTPSTEVSRSNSPNPNSNPSNPSSEPGYPPR